MGDVYVSIFSWKCNKWYWLEMDNGVRNIFLKQGFNGPRTPNDCLYIYMCATEIQRHRQCMFMLLKGQLLCETSNPLVPKKHKCRPSVLFLEHNVMWLMGLTRHEWMWSRGSMVTLKSVKMTLTRKHFYTVTTILFRLKKIESPYAYIGMI